MRWLVVLMAFLSWHGQAWALSLTGLEFNTLQGGLLEIRLGFDGSPPVPKSYTTEQPARISLDFEGVTNQLAQRRHAVDLGNTRSVNVVEANGRTRVVVGLVEMTHYQARVDGNAVVLTVGNEGAQAVLTQPKQVLGESFSAKGARSALASSIADVDFKRGASGEGQLVIDLGDPRVDVDVVTEGNIIRVRFLNTDVPENLKRRFDVLDFSTPVQSFSVDNVDGAAVVTIRPVNNDYDYLAYQTDKTYVVSLKPLSPQELEAKRSEFAYVGDKISLNFQDIEVRHVLQLVAEFTGLNLVASDTVGGRITLRLDETPWDQALDLILKAKGLDKRQVGNVLMVAPAAEIAERERQEIETRKQLQELAPLQTEYIRIKYAKAEEIFKLFESDDKADKDAAGSTGSLLSPRGQVVVDGRTNALLITETAERLEAVRRLINLIDVPVRQVMIEARIVIANSDFLEDLGIRWGGGIIDQDTPNRATLFSGSASSLATAMSNLSDPDEDTITWEYPGAYMVDMAAANNASRFAVGLLTDKFFVQAELSALATQGRGEIVSQPKIITGDKQKAVIKSGQEVPYLTSSSSGRTTVQFKEAVLKLDVTPSITPDGRIIMTLVIAQDSVQSYIAGELGSQIPVIDTNTLETQVLVDNGQTVVLGGVYRTVDLEQETKTPFLGDIPYLGRLFKRNYRSAEKQELLMFITPRILADSLLD